MKYLFIINPAAGGKSSKKEGVKAEINRIMTGRETDYEIYVTKGLLDAVGKIRGEAEEFPSRELRVIACGGDGTLNECVNGTAGFSNVSVTHYPCGTGNDFVKMFGDESGRFSDLSGLIDGELRPIDLIKCNDRYSINICSVGIDARVGIDVHKYSGLPLVGGKMSYVVSLVVNFFKGINKYMRIETENEKIEGKFALVCACNGRYYGGGFNPVRDAMPDDGKLDFLVVSETSRLKFLKVIGHYASGEYEKTDGLVRRIIGERMDIYGHEPFRINVDGEAIESPEAHFSVVRKGINFIFPKGMEFFKNRPLEGTAI